MKTLRRPVAWLLRTSTSALCRIERAPLDQVPKRGPLIVVMNHINSLEVPLLTTHLQPRPVTGVAKIETWDNRLIGWAFDLWEAIPIRRGELDLAAVRRALDVLASGGILIFAPEGTRSYHGRLLRGRPGVATLALHSGAPILPIVHWGGEKLSSNLKRFKRTDFHIRLGNSFFIRNPGVKITHEVRQAIADEVMVQLAMLLPSEYRGEYANISTTPKYLQFA